MERIARLVLACFGAWLVVACGTGSGAGLTSGSSGSGSGSTSSGGEPVDMPPCELANMLSSRCGQCHGEEVKAGALRSLVTHQDLLGSGDGHDSLAEACIARMELPSADEDRMPLAPRPVASADEIGLVRDFVNQGFPIRDDGDTCE